MVSTGQYVLGAALLAALILSLAFSAVCLRRRLLPAWEGAPARLVEAVVGVALLIWLSELLGLVSLLYAGTLVGAAVALAVGIGLTLGPEGSQGWPRRSLGFSPRASCLSPGGPCEKQDAAPGAATPGSLSASGGKAETKVGSDRVGGQALMSLIALGVVAVVFAQWGLTAKDALDRGIFNFDSLWYHLPFAVDIAQTHSVTGFFHPETVFTNWFYPQNSELVHAAGILLTGRDTLSLFVNFGWLALAFLAAWCIGRPWERGSLTVVAAAIVLDSNTLVVREPGAAKNDLMAAALLLAAIAILLNTKWQTHLPRVAWGRGAGRARRPLFRPNHNLGRPPDAEAKNPAPARHPSPTTGPAAETHGPGPTGPAAETHGPGPTGPAAETLPLAVAGLAAGLAVGTKSTAVAMAAALTVAVVFLAPAGRRWAAFGWWFLPALAGGGYWYLRNLVAAGNPLPQLESLGPISLPHPAGLQSGRPDFNVAHYATDTGVWHEYFAPGLHHAFGLLWPLVLAGAVAGGLLALLRRRNRLLRWIGAVALFGMLAYLFTPLSAAGAEGAPVGFSINIRYAIPALLAGLALLPLAPAFAVQEPQQPPDVPGVSRQYGWSTPGTSGWGPWWSQWALLAGLLFVWVVTDRPDAVLRDPDRLFAWLVALLAVLVPAGLLLARRRGASSAAIVAGFAVLVLATVAIAYPVQRGYLRDRYLNADPETSIPGMHLDSAYRWARGIDDARIGLVGTTAGFLEYGFYGTDLSNHVRYLGLEAPHGGFEPIPTCRRFRAAANAANLDYLVTSPFLNFIHPGDPVESPEAGWLRGEPAVRPVVRSGPVAVWKVRGRLDPAACGPGNAPLRRIPNRPDR